MLYLNRSGVTGLGRSVSIKSIKSIKAITLLVATSPQVSYQHIRIVVEYEFPRWPRWCTATWRGLKDVALRHYLLCDAPCRPKKRGNSTCHRNDVSPEHLRCKYDCYCCRLSSAESIQFACIVLDNAISLDERVRYQLIDLALLLLMQQGSTSRHFR